MVHTLANTLGYTTANLNHHNYYVHMYMYLEVGGSECLLFGSLLSPPPPGGRGGGKDGGP